MGAVGAGGFRNGGGDLPLELTSFVNREAQVAEAKARLRTSRLVTLTGMGGVGKTRLALRVAGAAPADFDHGVVYVQLDQLQSPGLMAATVAATLGLGRQSPRPPLDVVLEHLSDRRLLLLLDNCEHLLDACADLALNVLRGCPDVRILVTSRDPLRIYGEASLPVQPLAVPDPAARASFEDVCSCGAVTLFTDRAMAADPAFTLNEHNYAAVAEICQRLDGVPLAIELAAARVRTLPVDDIATRLADRYGFLTTRRRDVPARHQSMWDCIAWSYHLCSREDQLLWARLSVFTGSFELDAVEAVCAGDGLNAGSLLDLVEALVDKSIVIREPGNIARYRLLGLIRDFGRAKLEEAGDRAAIVRRRHGDCYIPSRPARPDEPTAEDEPTERKARVLRVLIVDRHRMAADGIRMVLDQHPDLEVVGIATKAGDAEVLAAATRPHVILADCQLPDSTGAELAARLPKDEPAARVLLLSSVGSDPLLREAVKAGAHGLILKTQPAEELVDAVRRAGGGEMLIPAGRLATMVADPDGGTDIFDPLTGREREVLCLMAAGSENKAIAKRLGIGYVTVRSHVRNLCSKLDARSRLEVVAKAAELGLITR